MSFEISVFSTMLPQRAAYTFDLEDEDDLDHHFNALKEMVSSLPASAEFRIKVLDGPGWAPWLADQLSEAQMAPLEVAELLRTAYVEDYSDTRHVMAVVYAQMEDRPTAASVIKRVDEGAYHVDYASNKEEAYADFGRSYEVEHGGMDLDGNEDYFDWEAFGKDTCDDIIQYADGDWYVWKEWA